MNILFICTHNRCRSILAEAIFQQQAHITGAALNIRSAGSQPAGVVHPESLAALNRHCVPTEKLSSQSWGDFQQWSWDLVITVCDSAAREPCPSYLNSAQRLHWNLQDPSSLDASIEDRAIAFDQLIGTLKETAAAAIKEINDNNHKAAIDCFEKAGAIVV